MKQIRIIVKMRIRKRPIKHIHRRIKKNFPFGRKAKARMKCKDCGELVKPKYFSDMRKEKRRKKGEI